MPSELPSAAAIQKKLSLYYEYKYKTMKDAEIDAVRCVLCPKAFISERALTNHVRLEHIEAYEAGDCSMWILIDDESNAKTETDTVKCLLCSKGFASEAALKNHAKLQHTNVFETGDPSIWKYEKASKHQVITKKQRTSHNCMKELRQNYAEELNTEVGCKRSDAIVFVDIKRERDENEDSNYSFPVETIIEEARSYVNTIGAFVELPTESECPVEESNSPPPKKRKKSTYKKLTEIDIGTPDIVYKIIEQKPKELIVTSEPEEQFPCMICQKKFKQPNNLDRHYRTHTNERPYKCKICEKSFSQLNNLDRHTKIHTSEKQFECEVCKKCFNQKNNLDRHFRTHTSERPFQCVLCEKSFSQKNNLDRHFRCHTGEEKFVCSVCKMSFNQKNNLARHMRVHDKKKQYYHEMIKKIVK